MDGELERLDVKVLDRCHDGYVQVGEVPQEIQEVIDYAQLSADAGLRHKLNETIVRTNAARYISTRELEALAIGVSAKLVHSPNEFSKQQGAKGICSIHGRRERRAMAKERFRQFTLSYMAKREKDMEYVDHKINAKVDAMFREKRERKQERRAIDRETMTS